MDSFSPILQIYMLQIYIPKVICPWPQVIKGWKISDHTEFKNIYLGREAQANMEETDRERLP